MSEVAEQELFSHYVETERETLGSLANLEYAEMHQKASGVFRLKGANIPGMRNEDRCPCCFFPFSGETIKQFKMTDLNEISELGLAFPFLFYLTIYLSTMLLTIFLISSIPNIVFNIVSDDQESYGQYSAIATASLGGVGKTSANLPSWPVALHLASVVILCVLFTIFTVKMRQKAKKLNEGIVTPADFTVVIKNLGSQWEEEKLKDHFEVHSRLHLNNSQPIIVTAMNVSFDITEHISVAKTIQHLTISRNMHFSKRHPEEQFLRCCLGCCRHSESLTKEDYDEKIQVQRGVLKALQGSTKDGLDRTGVAFVSFETEAIAKEVIKRWKSSIYQRFLFGICYFGSHRLFNGRPMVVKRAPDPTDIIWENLKYSRKSRIFRQFLMLVILAIILVISFFLLYGLAEWQKELSDSRDRSESTKGIDYTSIPAAVIILIVNILLDLAIRALAYLERHHTYTEQTLSTARKLTIVLSLNTLLFPLLAHLDEEDWYTSGGLANSIFWVAISVAFAKSLIKMVHPLWIWRAFRKWQIRRAINGSHLFVSQATANFYHQKEEIDIADCYSDLLVRFLFTLAYAPMTPLIVPIMLLGYLVDYWVNKYVLLRNSCRPKFLGEKITFKMMFFVKPAIALYGIGIYLFFTEVNDDVMPLSIAAITIGAVFWPLHSLVFSVLFRDKKQKQESKKKYNEVKSHFFPVLLTQTYEMANPVTRTRAKAELGLNQQPEHSKHRFYLQNQPSVPHFENLEAFNTQHFGLTGIWNLVLHDGFLDPFEPTDNGDQMHTEGNIARGARVASE